MGHLCVKLSSSSYKTFQAENNLSFLSLYLPGGGEKEGLQINPALCKPKNIGCNCIFGWVRSNYKKSEWSAQIM